MFDDSTFRTHIFLKLRELLFNIFHSWKSKTLLLWNICLQYMHSGTSSWVLPTFWWVFEFFLHSSIILPNWATKKKRFNKSSDIVTEEHRFLDVLQWEQWEKIYLMYSVMKYEQVN